MTKIMNDTNNFRLRKREKREIDRVVYLNKQKYDNRSHFVRCAIIKLLREEDKK